MNVTEAFEALKTEIANAEADAVKAATGQKAAGTRLRKAMQAVKDKAQVVRQAVMEERPGKSGEPEPVEAAE